MTGIDLSDDPTLRTAELAARTRRGREVADTLVTRRLAIGGFTVPARDTDVEEELRGMFDALDEDTFDERMAEVLSVAEKVSILERAMDDPYDTEAYEELMEDAGVQTVSAEDGEYDDCPVNWPATCWDVLEHYDLELHSAVNRLAAADEAARG